MNSQLTIQKDRVLPQSEDYFYLRKKGLEFIEQLGSEHWTDYNIHDPGITLMELLCYALTDLGYRSNFDIKDYLAKSLEKGGLDQAFYSALKILTSSPVTSTDYRKLLIDLPLIRNSWLICKECYCNIPLYTHCENSELVYSMTDLKVTPHGYYDVVLELESIPSLGDLNEGSISFRAPIFFGSNSFTVDLELIFPSYRLLPLGDPMVSALLDPQIKIFSIVADPLVNENGQTPDINNLDREIRLPLYTNLEIQFEGIGQKMTLGPIPVNVFLEENSDINSLKLPDIQQLISDGSESGIVTSYRKKMIKVHESLGDTLSHLQVHRNLNEDFCSVNHVSITRIAVCGDIDITPDADIERIVAQIYFEIGNYFNPQVNFYTLSEMERDGLMMDSVFNGPPLYHGFIKDKELDNSELKTSVFSSDIINLLFDIEGIESIRNFVFTVYDDSGRPVLPSQPWIINLKPGHIPRLYIRRSKLLFFKNGLPFLPANSEEVKSILTELKGSIEQVKLSAQEHDIVLPGGNERDLQDYFPLQYSLPLNYGVGEEGLPSNATSLRKAQAKQLKAYLFFYEQIFGNVLAQLNNLHCLFSLDTSGNEPTYFSHFFTNDDISEIEKLYIGNFSSHTLNHLVESKEIQLLRKNGFLDHMLARFGEQFANKVFMQHAPDGQKLNRAELIIKKKLFLKNIPETVGERYAAFNYLDPIKVCGFQNISGLKQRLSYLLGLNSRRNLFDYSMQNSKNTYKGSFSYADGLLLPAYEMVSNSKLEIYQLIRNFRNKIIAFVGFTENYTTPTIDSDNKWSYYLKDGNSATIAQSSKFDSKGDALMSQVELLEKVNQIQSEEEFFIVEHLLLAPRIPGQVLLPICLGTECDTCAEEDPYSFRITAIMPGWINRFSDLSFRDFAENTIKKESPAHQLVKICWVGNDICRGEGEHAILCILQKSLQAKLTIPADEIILNKICRCAEIILEKFNKAVREWTVAQDVKQLTKPKILTELQNIFDQTIKPDKVICKDSLDVSFLASVKKDLSEFFADHILCFQYNTFRHAWCNWLEAQQKIDWMLPALDLLMERFFRLLNTDPIEICQCSTVIIQELGETWRTWLEVKITNKTIGRNWSKTVKEHTLHVLNTVLPDCVIKLKTKDKNQLVEIINEYYSDKKEILICHARLIRVFQNLKSIYPPASLHDCEDGNDDNPVRLNHTILG